MLMRMSCMVLIKKDIQKLKKKLNKEKKPNKDFWNKDILILNLILLFEIIGIKLIFLFKTFYLNYLYNYNYKT